VQRVLLLIPSTSYRARDYLDAARRLDVEIVVGSDHRQALEKFSGGRSLALEFTPIGEGVARILEYARRFPLRAIIGTDDETAVLAAAASKVLRLPHNDPESVAIARDKHRFRQAMARGGVRSPWFRRISLDEDLEATARSISYPCVLKPLNLSASRGVIRADDAAGFVAASRRIRNILGTTNAAAHAKPGDSILVEAFIPGREVALEGLLERARLRTLALFDKPDPLDGPYFEETIYVTPSRLPEVRQREITAEVDRAACALGLREGPVHAELRVNDAGVWMLELAARTIGGLCSRVLRFAPGVTLEELVLRHALAQPTDHLTRHGDAAGVMMIPIPHAGRLRAVAGLDAARSIPAIDDVIISVTIDDWLVALPEGDRYLGFIFATGDSPAEVEGALRRAHRQLAFDIERAAA
jgi:biotin carboxylase